MNVQNLPQEETENNELAKSLKIALWACASIVSLLIANEKSVTEGKR